MSGDGDVDVAKVPHANDAVGDYERYVNPQWARLLGVMQMNVEYGRCEGAELHSAEGRRILDFNSGILRSQHRP